MKKTLIINFFGGPGTGKSTMAAWLFAQLKMMGIDCEYVTEFAKDKVWENNKEAFKNQFYITGKQSFRISRCNGKVDIVITDSPIALGAIYEKENPYFAEAAIWEFARYVNFNIVLKRAHAYNENGRNQTEEEAKAIDGEIVEMLKDNHQPFIEETTDPDGCERLLVTVVAAYRCFKDMEECANAHKNNS